MNIVIIYTFINIDVNVKFVIITPSDAMSHH